MANVFVPQQPSRHDPGSGLWIPTINLTPAARFGSLVVLLPPQANRLGMPELVAAMKRQMASFSADDFIVAVGDPTLLAAAACIATRKTGGTFRMLKWDRMAHDYFVTEIDV